MTPQPTVEAFPRATPLAFAASGSRVPGALGPWGLLVLAILLAPAACDLTDPGPVPDVIEVTPAALEFEAFGAQRTLSATLLDTDGQTIEDASFEFTSDDPDIATANPGGFVVSRGNGSTTIRVRSRGIEHPVPVTVSQTGALLAVISGRDQSAEIGQPLEPVRLQLTDPRGNLASGILLVGEVEAGGGLLAADTARTGPDGRAGFEWTLGPEIGPGQRIRIIVDPERSADAAETSVTVTARAHPGSPAGLELLTPSELTAHRGLPLAEPVRARVVDVFDRGLEGERVRVSIAGHAARTLESDSAGHVEAEWLLSSSLDPQILRLEVLDGLDDAELERVVTALPFSEPDRIDPLGPSARSDPPGTELGALRVRLTDRAELPMDATEIEYRVLEGAGRFHPAGSAANGTEQATATTDPDGHAHSPPFRLPDTPGVTRVQARVPDTEVRFEFTLTAQFPVDRIVVVSGDGQSATEREILPEAVTVELLGAGGQRLEGVPVHFSAERGGVEFPLVITDEAGRATTRWRLGWGSGPEHLWIEADSVVTVVTARSLPISGGDESVHTPRDIDSSTHRIELVFAPNVPAEARPILEAAASRWDRIVTGDLPPIFLDLQADACANDLPLLGTVDDLMIFVQVLDVDGPGGTAAYAGPCAIRGRGAFPVIGLTVIDEGDLPDLIADDLLHDVAVHEFAHVLGFGTTWGIHGLLRNPADTADASIDTHFSGARARAAFDSIGGHAYEQGVPVPVENQLGGSGTLNGHWRWNVFHDELMTGFISPGPSPLSAVTVASLADLGYEVAIEEADGYSLSFEAFVRLQRGEDPRPHEAARQLGDDVYHGPLRVIGPDGRLLDPGPNP